MKKKNYKEPTMRVVLLQHTTHLLNTSGQVSATMNGQFVDDELI